MLQNVRTVTLGTPAEKNYEIIWKFSPNVENLIRFWVILGQFLVKRRLWEWEDPPSPPPTPHVGKNSQIIP